MLRRWSAVVVVGLAGGALGAVPPTDRPVYFVRDVAPIFDRNGCSSAPCHGKIGGQGGLALSLMTLAPVMDHAPLEPVVNLRDPERSLLLLKPTAQVEHGGGRRFKVGSDEYETILRWIREGCRNPQREPLPTRVSVKPERFVFGPRSRKGEITVYAEFADGAGEDVTDRTVFLSQDDAVAEVSPKGWVRGERWGSTAVLCRYAGMTKAVFVSMPRESAPDDPPAAKVPERNIIDTLVFKNLEWLGLHPSPVCDDYAFLRRVSLDLTGALPTPEEIRAFVADSDPNKREKVVDRLLEDPRFVALRTLRLADMLRINPRRLANGPLQNRAAMVFDHWLRDQVRTNSGYDQLARSLLSATGSAMQVGPVNFYRVEPSPQDRAETVAQALLGVRLACARCHNHPFDRWTTDDYWQFAAFMAKVRERPGELFGEGVFYHDNRAELRNQSVTSAKRNQVAVPTLLGEPSFDPGWDGDYVEALADWVVDRDNPFFARAAVNRIWSHLFGRGIVDPVDDIRETSVPAVPALLGVLSRWFVEHDFDTKALIRLIVTSSTYQLASDTDEVNQHDTRFFSHYVPKQMLAQVLLDAINQACGTVDRYGAFPPGTTAVGLPLMMPNPFLDRFGRSNREFLATLDPHVEPTLPQTLHLINSGYINGKISANGGTVERLVRELSDDRAVVVELYLRTFCRPPSDAELERVLAYVAQVGGRREAFEDLLWSLVTSREFLFIG